MSFPRAEEEEKKDESAYDRSGDRDGIQSFDH